MNGKITATVNVGFLMFFNSRWPILEAKREGTRNLSPSVWQGKYYEAIGLDCSKLQG